MKRGGFLERIDRYLNKYSDAELELIRLGTIGLLSSMTIKNKKQYIRACFRLRRFIRTLLNDKPRKDFLGWSVNNPSAYIVNLKDHGITSVD